MADRAAPLKPLEGAQAIAAHPGRQIWLSASAGTGKTHVLTARVLRLLLSGAAPQSILCLTFTKAGAAEMAERVHRRLASWVRARDPDLAADLEALGEPFDPDARKRARRLFARVLDAPGGGLRIQTIHAFCQTLLAGFPAEAGLTPGFRPLDGRAEAALARATLADLLVTAERGGDLGLIRDVQALGRRMGEDKAERYLRLCARAPDALESLGPREGIEARLRTALDVPLGDVEAAIAEACADGLFDCATLRRIVAANLAWGTTTGARHADLANTFLSADAAGRALLLDGLIGLARTKKGDPLAFSAKLLGCDPEHDVNCARLAEAIELLLGMRRRAGLAALLGAALRAGQAYALAYAYAKRGAGAVDFDDLIRLTVRLLEEPGIGEWIRYKLDTRTNHILVDEGQDTNADQWRIVRALADEFFAEDPDDNMRVRTIFSVGDFKQAIFGFQGTDPAAFGAARAYFERAANDGGRRMERLDLDRSFRSSPAVLRVVDQVIMQLGGDALGIDDAIPPHLSALAGLPGEVTLWKPIAQGVAAEEEEGEEGWIDDATRDFASRLARQIKLWLADPPWVASRGRTLRPEDILILVRKRAGLASLIVARLHAEHVEVAGVDRLRLDAPLAVKDLMAAIRFVLQPEDDLNLACLLVSPLFGLSQDDLYAVAFGRGGGLWRAVRDKGARDVTDGLRGLLAQADLTTPHGFLKHILSGPLDGRRKLMQRLGIEARDPIDELVNAALGFESEATPTLQRFLDWFDRDEVEIARDPSAPLDAVRVMTAHGAKGLEAPWVILADATGDPDSRRADLIDWPLEEDGPKLPVPMPRREEIAGSLADALAAAKRREREEHWRLLYVALTRAKERLFVGGALGSRARGVPPAESWYQAVDTALGALGAKWRDDPTWGAVRLFAEGAAVGRKARAATPTAPVADLPEWLHRQAPAEARPPRPLAPSALGDDSIAEPPPDAGARAAARRGALLHGLFERLPAIAADQRRTLGDRWLAGAAGIEDPGARAELLGAACAIIADPAHAMLFAADALAEAPIAAVIGDGVVVAGTVDRLVVTPDRVLVVDFKTGRNVPKDADAVPLYHLRQMAAYAAALAVIFPDRAIEAALLYTAGPRLIMLPPAMLAAAKPSLAGEEQKLGVDG